MFNYLSTVLKTGITKKILTIAEDELNEKKDISLNDFVNASVLEEQIKQKHIIEFGN